MTESVPVISRFEMLALEMNAEFFGISTLQLMENAGSAIAREIAKRFDVSNRIAIYAGTGGNGGDGCVAARHLAELGYTVHLILVGRAEDIRRDVVKTNWNALNFMTDCMTITIADDSSRVPSVDCTVNVDALLGIGARGPLRQPILAAVTAFNAASGFKVAVDVPTGVDCDTGEVVDIAAQADLTVTFHKAKLGLLKAKRYVGELVVASIGLPSCLERYIGPGDVMLTRKPRFRETHKGDYGRLVVLGGSETYSGAPALASLAALRVGIDVVYTVAPVNTAHDIAALSPNLITVKLNGDYLAPVHLPFLFELLERATAVVLGPGLGLHPDTQTAVVELVTILEKMNKPLLLDADGLKALANRHHRFTCPCVLTPHGGELQILMGIVTPKDEPSRVGHVAQTASTMNATVLLKGPVDIVSNGVQTKINRIVHNPGMTVGGTGDVLSGVVGALLSQGFDPFRSAVAGVFINGAAGDFAAQKHGYHLVASDLVEFIPAVMRDPMSHVTVRRL
ncbi:MAG: NAD(P)H-hydrate dehydratase [Candidatus Bathyarchaeota archaeon]|nr:MAG: NAD(P)H-hydrate dehydratase [Candidatus Bathyarchaeota archaeon]